MPTMLNPILNIKIKRQFSAAEYFQQKLCRLMCGKNGLYLHYADVNFTFYFIAKVVSINASKL